LKPPTRLLPETLMLVSPMLPLMTLLLR